VFNKSFRLTSLLLLLLLLFLLLFLFLFLLLLLDRISLSFPGGTQICELFTSVSQITGIRSVNYHTWMVLR
jgi:hypothetical protein